MFWWHNQFMNWHSDFLNVIYEYDYELPKYFIKLYLSCQVHYIFFLIASID